MYKDNSYISSNQVVEIFDVLNGNIEYVLLRNINNELPDRLKETKDIDILVNSHYKSNLITLLKKEKWLQIIHPWDFGDNFNFLYSMDEFLMFRKGKINLDVCFQLCCRSLNAGEWFPLDESIQKSVFTNKRKKCKNDFITYRLSYEDELIHLITRCIFDKKIFNDGYIERIQSLLGKIDMNLVSKKLEKIFFKFTPFLIQLLLYEEYSQIRNNYITFKEY